MADPSHTVYSDPDGSQQTQSEVLVVKKNSRGRLIMVLGGIFLCILLAFAAMSFFRKAATTDSGSLPAPPSGITAVPGASTSDRYTKTQQEENLRRQQEEGTTMPVLTGPTHNANDPFPINEQPVNPAVVDPANPAVPVVDVPPATQVVVQPVATTPPASTVVVAAAPDVGPQYSPEKYAAMAAALGGYIEAWQVAPAPAQEFSFNGAKVAPNADPAAQGGSMGAGPLVAGQGVSTGVAPGAPTAMGAPAQSGPSFVRAGTVIPAMLLSVIDSDNPGPILAQITSGPLAGTRLMGQFQSTGKALLLNFTTLSRPGMATYSVNVVAVDENYASGMKTDVNNHYLRRYGLLIAASFLQGYGEAIGRANTTVVTGPFGSTVTQGPLSSDQARKVAIGNVGESLTESLLTESKVPPTVKLDCGGGCPVGLLFLSDL